MLKEPLNPFVELTYDAMRFLGESAKRVENVFADIRPLYKQTDDVTIPAAFSPTQTQNPGNSFSEPDKHFSAAPVPNAPVKDGVVLSEIPFADKDEFLRAEFLARDFDAKTATMQQEALDQIKKLSLPVALAILQELLASQQDRPGQVEVLTALSALKVQGDVDKELFKGCLTNSNPEVRLAALKAISKYKDEESFVILSSAIKDVEPDIRRQVLGLICWTHGERSVPFIMRLLHDIDVDVRKFAIQMCGTFKVQQAVFALITLLKDEDAQIQRAANTELRKITKQDFQFQNHKTPMQRNVAIEAWRSWWIEHRDAYAFSVNGNGEDIEINTES